MNQVKSTHSPKQIGVAKLTQIGEFDEIIDVRSPAEFTQDHLPGAVNYPVLDDAERARVGTIYKQESPFAAKKIGATLIARNIAQHLEQHLLDRPRQWRPLVYCWRGGQRSGALVHILRQIGWDAQRLEGGHKAWRQQVVEQLNSLPTRYTFQVISGATGSGKSRLLEALAAQGAQVLHLEQLAAHKGSLLGPLPDTPQPTQKTFETRLYQALQGFDTAHPVFVEAESRRIGHLQLPDALLTAIRNASGLQIEAPLPARIEFLLRDYEYFLRDPDWLLARLNYLQGLQSNETLSRWRQLVAERDFPRLVSELLEGHYDPLYRRSQLKSRAAQADNPRHVLEDLSDGSIARLAEQMLKMPAACPNCPDSPKSLNSA
jgi:tRNA 2-selenouridine synthase